jgi:Fe-S-cluster containining protein
VHDLAATKERQDLFGNTVRDMGRRLSAAAEAEQVFAALAWGMGSLDRTYATTAAPLRAQVACRAGCSHCCHVPVDVQAHEVFYAAEHIQLNFPPEDLAEIIARTAMHSDSIAALMKGERPFVLQPCPLLDAGGSCSIYEGRPEICRAHHASDATACAAATVPGEFDQGDIPALHGRMFAVMLGLDEAMESAGFDARAYDFGSALHEALTDSLCLVRWMRRQPAFPDSCLAD